jgi:integrase
VEKYKERKHERYLTEREYLKVGAALRFSSLAPGIKTALELLLLTGARPCEIASLEWAFVDLPGRALHLPDSKTGKKTIHLSDDAVQVLTNWPRHVASPYVFPGTGRRQVGTHLHPHTLTHAWMKIRKQTGLTGVRLYDACRHSFASIAASEHGLSLPQIGAQLGHTQASTTQRYAHLIRTVQQEHAAKVQGTIAARLKGRLA